MFLARRGFLTGLASALSAPAIVRISSLMPVKVMPPGIGEYDFGCDDLVRAYEKFSIAMQQSWVEMREKWLMSTEYDSVYSGTGTLCQSFDEDIA